MSNTPTAEEFLRALPPVLRNDSRMIALGQVVAEELSDRMSEIEKAAIYPRIDELDEALLDILAYDFKVDWYGYDYPLETKRALLKSSFYTQWKDHVTNPSNCFNITKNDDGTYQITRAGTVMQQGTPQDAAHFTNQENGIWELFACYGLLLNYARQMGWDVERGSINLTNTAKPYPFNNSQKTVALQMQRPSRDYIVITEASNVKGNLGQIEVSDQLSNGFKVAYTGSATAATINYIVIGGYMK